jgi:hypothetical protein
MGEALKNGENLISSSLVVFPTLPRHSQKDEPTDCASVSLVFEFLLLFSRRKQIPFWHFSLFLLELITFSLGCVCRGANMKMRRHQQQLTENENNDSASGTIGILYYELAKSLLLGSYALLDSISLIINADSEGRAVYV